MSKILQNTVLLKSLTVLVIFGGALLLLLFTYTAFPNREELVNEPCLTEDCIVGISQSGIPFRSAETVRYEGWNCRGNSNNNCATRTTKDRELILNYLFNVLIITSILFIARKIVTNKQAISK